jgi:mono/diheme cytochrome c family protein
MSEHRRFARLLGVVVVSLLLPLALGVPEAAATSATDAETGGAETGGAETGGAETGDTETASSDDAIDPAELARLQLGAQVYTSSCSSCHQPGGVGLAGQYPPLLNNPHVADAAYVAEVIENGRQGPIEVLGESYDGVMPSFGTLADDEVDAVIGYLQNGLVVPGVAPGEQASGPVLATDLPSVSLLSSGLAFLTFLALAGLMLSPLVLSSQDRLQFPLVDAWLRSAVIVVATALVIVFVPNLVLTSEPVSRMERFMQDLIGVTVFGLGLVALLGGLWWAHRESRV